LYFLFSGLDPTVGRAFYQYLLLQVWPASKHLDRIAVVFSFEILLFPSHLNSLSFFLSLLASLFLIYLFSNKEFPPSRMVRYFYWGLSLYGLSLIMSVVCAVALLQSVSLIHIFVGSFLSVFL